FFFFQAEDGIRDFHVTGVQTCALPISCRKRPPRRDDGLADVTRRDCPQHYPARRGAAVRVRISEFNRPWRPHEPDGGLVSRRELLPTNTGLYPIRRTPIRKWQRVTRSSRIRH